MVYYYWFHVRLAHGASIPAFLDYWQPTSLDIRPTHNGLHSVLFTSTTHPHNFYSWAASADWCALGWMNECMTYPANLGYTHTQASFNAFVTAYGYTDQRL